MRRQQLTESNREQPPEPPKLTKIQRVTLFCTNLTINDQYDLTLRQLTILLVVYGTEATLTTREIGELLSLNRSSMSRSGERLAKFDLVIKTPDPRAANQIVLTRTIKGQKYYDKLRLYLG